MKNISVIVIVKNEEKMIADCLDSVSFCDEIIVIDGGSEDRTVEIAKRMRATVFFHKSDDFSDIRNFGLQKATMDWVLYVDVDERVSKELKEEIVRVVSKSSTNKETNYFFVNRKNFYFGTYEWPCIERLERLFKKNSIKRWYGKLHESPIVSGEAGYLDGFLLHYTHRDLTSMIAKTNIWSNTEAELRYKAGHPKMAWWRFFRVMLTAFLDSYVRQGGWRVGTIGLIESLYQAFSNFITYAKLWEMQQEKK